MKRMCDSEVLCRLSRRFISEVTKNIAMKICTKICDKIFMKFNFETKWFNIVPFLK